MLLHLFLLLLGFALLLFGADKLVASASSIAGKLGVSPLIIGLTIVAFGTSAPELVINVISSYKGSSEMVMGNVLGSNIFNILVIGGTCALIYPLSVQRTTTWIEVPLGLLAAFAIFFASQDRLIDRASSDTIQASEGWMLLLFFLVFFAYSIAVALKSKDTAQGPGAELLPYAWIWLPTGLLLLLYGGHLLVENAKAIASLLGMSERLIGLTIVSIGTSLPELVTGIVAVRKKQADIAIGNIVGSNIFNGFLVLGISATIRPIPVTALTDVYVHLLAAALLFVLIFRGAGRQIDRVEGGFLLFLYGLYMTSLLLGIG